SGTDLSIDADDLQEIKQIVPEACHVVFVDGQYSAELSDDLAAVAKQGVDISPLSEMNASQGQLAEAMVTNANFSDTNIFQYMTLGLVNSGLFIHVEQNTEVEQPLHIIYVNGPTKSAVVQTPVNFIRLGTNSRFTCIQHFVNSDESKAITIPADFFDLAEGSGIQSYRIGVESDQTDHISNSYARIADSARFVSHQYLLGSRLTRSNTEVLFDGEGAEAVLRGIYLGDNDQHLDIRTYVDHAKPNCMSDQHFRGILGGKARGVFNGLVMVQKDAQHTNAEQSNKNLLLSREARVDTKPQLEIYADDVKCGHGATVGELDEDALFYLQSRGIGREEAAQMLIHAFAAEVTQDITIGSLQPYILEKLDKKLSEISGP
ncbi:MAG: Fe-S cluster assembly protein SufD, partial [Candidatus Marinimicrobia bacterium]|nr:Fe-S cluster assembly protein SufD [Candidatus Neomarinimicrobiota bacterium]